MRMSKAERIARLYARLQGAGFSYSEAQTLRRIEMTLSRWNEHECNGAIQRDGEDGDGKPRWYYENSRTGEVTRGPLIADRERGAIRRLNALMQSHGGHVAYLQGDPRGCALYIVPKSEMQRTGLEVGAVYTNGIAVCE